MYFVLFALYGGCEVEVEVCEDLGLEGYFLIAA